MARIKRDQDREAKRNEIVAAARALFMDEGYEATSMNRLAAAAGVAPNTIYWYFENKDDVLIAVLNRVVSHVMVEVVALQSQPIRTRILTLIDQIESAGSLMTDVHSRVSHSPKVQAWHDQFHAMVEQLSVTELVNAGVSKDEAQLDAKLLIYVIEGLLAHPHKLQEREQIIDQALKRVLG
jgi:AcrR family transcriptional regulator